MIPMNELIALFPRYSRQDQVAMKQALDLLLGSSRSNDPEGPLYVALQAAAGANSMPFACWRKSRSYSAWLTNEKLVMEFIQRHWSDHSKVALESLKHFLFRMLIEEVHRRGLKATIGTLSRTAGDIPAIFEQNFPGYLKAGMANLIMITMVNGHGKHR